MISAEIGGDRGRSPHLLDGASAELDLEHGAVRGEQRGYRHRSDARHGRGGTGSKEESHS